jgi:hypothetical protein
MTSINKRRGRPKKDTFIKDGVVNDIEARASIANAIAGNIIEDEDQPKKRRGRKPKEKVEDQPKKRRGRKRKCEMNIGLYENISGFSENSIDTDGKLVQFTNPLNNNKSQCDVISFGVLNIQRRDIVPVINNVPVIKNTEENKNGKCRIDLTKILDHEIIEPTENKDIVQKKNKDISDFFGIKRNGSAVKQDEPDEPYEDIKSIPTSGLWGMVKDPKARKKINDTDPSIYFLHHLRGKKTELPTKTDTLCWWCCHKFDTVVRYAPTDYDEIKDRFIVTGMFCTWNCVKAYLSHENIYRTGQSIFATFIRKMYGKDVSINAAPPRQTLKSFGGTLSIEEFRNKFPNTSWEIRTNKMLISDHYLSVPSSSRRRK